MHPSTSTPAPSQNNFLCKYVCIGYTLCLFAFFSKISPFTLVKLPLSQYNVIGDTNLTWLCIYVCLKNRIYKRLYLKSNVIKISELKVEIRKWLHELYNYKKKPLKRSLKALNSRDAYLLIKMTSKYKRIMSLYTSQRYPYTRIKIYGKFRSRNVHSVYTALYECCRNWYIDLILLINIPVNFG